MKRSCNSSRSHEPAGGDADGSAPAFRHTVLPGRPDAGAFGLQARCLQESDDVGVKLRIAIQDGVPIGAGIGERLA